MSSVLILGNGISRLLHEDMIKSWSGELWACNYAFLEWGDKITRLTGHVDVLEEAATYRERHGYTFEIWTGNLGLFKSEAPYIKLFTCPRVMKKDSGTTLVAQALTEGFDKILLCGFDIGGRDIYSRKLHTQEKTAWVNRWQLLRRVFGTQFESAIQFIGYDHKPMILKGSSKDTYSLRYKRGLPHIPDPEYVALFNLLYGERQYEHAPKVLVRYLRDGKAGWERPYAEKIANALVAKGEVEILGPYKEPFEPEITVTKEITKGMRKDTLLKIAEIRGNALPANLTKAEILEMFENTEPKDIGRLDFKRRVIE